MIQLLDYPIKSTIYKCSKYSLTLYINGIGANEYKSTYNVEYNANIYFSMPFSKDANPQFWKTRTFGISKTSLRGLRRTLERVLKWFDKDDPKYTNVFFTDESGVLWLNTEYSKLYEVFDKGFMSNETLKFIPSIVELPNNVKAEGVRIYFNIIENSILLTYRELVILYDLICDIDIPNLVKTTLEVFRYSLATNKYANEEEYLANLKSKKFDFKE